MPVLTPSMKATLQRVLSQANFVLPAIEMLESLAQINPQLKGRVAELRAQREYQISMATAALEIDRQLDGSASPRPTSSPYGEPGTPIGVPGGTRPGMSAGKCQYDEDELTDAQKASGHFFFNPRIGKWCEYNAYQMPLGPV